ncbi:hypothetical protein B0A52_01872 [Exophiala mesophila]|uniref:Major facilitator superfamily (MFS) profile domain-containing protein n=1 Tax=Exophiala mesophila TaxID=212818 RepID=A0A438NE91_EXOME|nr:hypothetical protein B0A52_01872 [Exophiala mesophila]
MIASYRYLRKKRRQRQLSKAENLQLDTTGQTPSSTVTNGSQKKKKCPVCVKEKSAARKYRWKIILCLLPAFLDASLDLTVIATALPRIASHFNRFNQLNWIVTAFSLTSTAFIPVYGQLADTFGRFPSIMFSAMVVATGSVLCASAPVWGVLLLGRALQGIGAAGVQNVTIIILADKVTLKEQSINTSIFQMMGGVGYSIGPVIGGYLTNSSWRYCFALSCCLSAISMTGLFLLRNELLPGRITFDPASGLVSRIKVLGSGLVTLDFGGIFLFIAGVGLVILGTAWGGSTYPWSSSAVIASLVIGVVMMMCFVAWELSLASGGFLHKCLPRTTPMIPASILSAKDVSLVCFLSFGSGTALFSVFYFVGIYFTLVEGYRASHAGEQLLFYVPGLGFGVIFAIFICNKWPRQTFWPLYIGTIIETIGIGVICYAVQARRVPLINGMMYIAGAGTGMRFMPANLHLAGMFRNQLAAVYSLLRFAMPFGGTVGLTIMGAVFQNKMSAYFGTAINGQSIDLHQQSSLEVVSELPAEEQAIVRAQGANATMWAFVSILPLLAITIFSTMALGNVWIVAPPKKSQQGTDEPAPPPREDGKCAQHADEEVQEDVPKSTSVDVLEEVFLLALLRGDVQRLKKKGPEAAQRNVVSTQPTPEDSVVPIADKQPSNSGVDDAIEPHLTEK